MKKTHWASHLPPFTSEEGGDDDDGGVTAVVAPAPSATEDIIGAYLSGMQLTGLS